MKAAIALCGMAILAGTLCAAADSSRAPPPRQNAYEMPFPRSARAQSVWSSGVCWSECGANCAWGVAGCLQRDAQGVCLAKGDTCDRYCLRQCRTSGGPLLPDYLDW